MRNVAILSFAQTPYLRSEKAHNEVEMLMPVLAEVIQASGLDRKEIGFTCSGSSDYLAGQAFSFVSSVDALGAWPPITESHIEMDGAFALYEAWVKIQCGEVDTALAFCFSRSSMGETASTLVLQLDPYTVAPLHLDAISAAALQARQLLDSGKISERQMAEIASRSRRDAINNPDALLKGEFDVEAILAEPHLVSPLRKHDCPPITDGAAAIVLASEEAVAKLDAKPVWIRGIDHRLDPHSLGVRDLTQAPSARLAAEKAGIHDASIDVAELHAPFSHQEWVLREALGLGQDVRINPSGGALAANAILVAGLARIGEAARQIQAGDAHRAVAHATSGPCLQQNLVCVLEGE
jgi:acetyl-CoA acetyltransferase